MRVCLYTETALPVVGGQELAIDAIARCLPALGHEALVLTLAGRGGRPAADHALPYPVLRHRRYVSTRYFLRWYCRALDAAYRRFPFNVLHCHNVYPAGYVGALWANRRRVPLVITSHACDIAPESHLLKKSGVAERMELVLQSATALVTISTAVRDRYVALGGQPNRIVMLPNGVDTTRLGQFASLPERWQGRVRAGNYFLFLGRLEERKGADLLIDAFRRIAGEHPVNLVIAGVGPQGAKLEQAVAAAGLQSRVFFPGLVSGADKDFLLQNALATVMPSRIAEGSSLVVLESFAAGRAVIGSAVAGLIEAIQPRCTGLLFRENSVDELAAALQFAIREPSQLAAWGAEAQRLTRVRDWHEVTRRHVELYESLSLGNCSARAA